jgi:hypothetical protein
MFPRGSGIWQRPSVSSKVRPGTPVTILLDMPKSKPVPAKLKRAPAASQTTTTTTTAAPTTVPDLSGKNEQRRSPSVVQRDPRSEHRLRAFTRSSWEHRRPGQAGRTQIAAASSVQINISKGPGRNPTETVPEVRGKTLPEALTEINGQQLRLIYLKQPVTTPQQAGTIIMQTPLPGAHAPRNGQVLVYLAAFRPNG